MIARHLRVTVLESPASGRSPLPDPAGRWTVSDYAQDALAVLDGLGIDRAHVLGSSLGAAAALELAATAPGRVRSLLLNAGLVHADAELRELLHSWIDVAGRAQSLDELLTAVSLSASPASLQADRLIHRWLDRPAPVDAPRDERARSGFAAAAGALLAFDGGQRLGAVTAPTLLTVGADDDVVPLRHTQQLAAVLPRAVVHVCAGCGHQPFQEQPELFGELAGAFFAGAGALVRAVA